MLEAQGKRFVVRIRAMGMWRTSCAEWEPARRRRSDCNSIRGPGEGIEPIKDCAAIRTSGQGCTANLPFAQSTSPFLSFASNMKLSKTTLDRFLCTDRGQCPRFDIRELPLATQFAATGGARVSLPQLQDVCEGSLETASNCGMGIDGIRNGHARLDRETAPWLVDSSPISDSEALSDECWSFVGVVIATGSCVGGSGGRGNEVSEACGTHFSDSG